MKKIFVCTLLCLMGLMGRAQGIDPTLARMIGDYTDKAEKELKTQAEVMGLETTGHLWIREEVDGTTSLQREFNRYLDSFRSIVSYAAEVYGFYQEVDRLVNNLGSLNAQLAVSPGNALAVALSARRNQIYRDIILQSVDIVNDIRLACLSGSKMTEKERMETVFGIRPKLKQMNRKLQRLAKAVKYTSLSKVWNEIQDRPASGDVDKAAITRQCMQRWKRNGRNQ
jgi:hypothetical protein